jgi:5-methylcytosine-specific restriction enzyme subunit McrC
LSPLGDPIVIREHEDSPPVRLSVAERDALQRVAPAISVRPLPESEDLYSLNPGNLVGALQLGDLRFELRPKLAVRRLLFLLGYSLDPGHWLDREFGFEAEPELFEAIVHGFCSGLERALLLGPLQGYRFEEESLQTIRGRIRFDDHVRSRFGLVPPIECEFDEFTEDIEINRLLKAAIVRLGEIRLRSSSSRRRLRALLPQFANVALVRYDPGAVPAIRFDRRTERYRGPVELARLVLRSRSVDARSGGVASAAFLLDLARVFEDFVAVALEERLRGDEGELVRHAKGRGLHLDAARGLRLEPDLSWWRGSTCLFVGDVKYKRTKASAGHHPDVYQLLAYTTATGLRRGLLVYAADDAAATGLDAGGAYRIVEADKTIEVRALDLDVPSDAVLEQVDELAAAIRRQRADRLERPAPAASAPLATSPA